MVHSLSQGDEHEFIDGLDLKKERSDDAPRNKRRTVQAML
jgi:hypothetical protein